MHKFGIYKRHKVLFKYNLTEIPHKKESVLHYEQSIMSENSKPKGQRKTTRDSKLSPFVKQNFVGGITKPYEKRKNTRKPY